MEKAFSFGPSDSLSGVLNESSSATAKTRPTIIILNAGLVHHVGPHRTTVELARAIEDLGFNVFRFDLSAIGDSKPRKSRLGYQERAIQEIRDAMDFLSETNQAKEFILSGLCTGADFAHRAAVADERVVGSIFMDGYAYPTARFHFLNVVKKTKVFLGKVFVAERWARFIHKKTSSLRKSPPINTSASPDSSFVWTLPEKQQSAKDYALLINRKVNLFFIFTASEAKSFNYQEQVADSFKHLDFGSSLKVTHLPLSDHTFTFHSQRKLMMQSICLWLTEKYPAG